MNEEWKPVQDFEGYYEVSSSGKVRNISNKHRRVLKNKLNRHTGYLYVSLYKGKGSKARTRPVHRLVAEAFLDNPCSKPEINHLDEDKTNNALENLEWATSHENNVHSAHRRRKRVEVYSPEGELLAVFESVSAMASITGISKASISQNLHGRSGLCDGLVIRFAKE